MKILKYTNANKTIDVEYLTDIISANDSLTIYQVSQYVNEAKQIGLNGTAIVFGMPDDIDETTLTAMKAVATSKNLTLKVLEAGQATVTLNTLTDLAITTESIDAGVAGAAQIEVVTVPTVAEAQIEVLTVPATAAATQADYFTIENVAGVDFACWLDIDAAGTAPTGAIYVASTNKVEVNIVTGGTAPANAALVKAALEANENWDGITIVDNEDGTLTFTQDLKGAVDNIVVKSANDGGAGSFSKSVTNEGVSGIEQGDYVVLKNALSQETVAVWMNVDSDDTEPTGAIYLASDYQVKVDVATGATSATNAGAFATALALETDWAGEVTILDLENGTVRVTQDYNGVVAVAVKKNADDSGVGAITTTTSTLGTVGTAYDFDFEAEGGNAPYIWTTESTLPEGITLSTDGTLSGTPREVGTFPLTVTVTDQFGIEVELEAENFVVSAS